MSKCKHAGKVTPNGETKVTTSCGEEYSVLGRVDPAEKRNVIYCAFCGKAIKLKIKKADAMTRHHDDIPEHYEVLAVAFEELNTKLKETAALIDASTGIPYQVQDALRHFANDICDFADLVDAWRPRRWDPMTNHITKVKP